MSTSKRRIQTIIKGLKALTKEAEKMERLVSKLEAQGQLGAKASKMRKAKPQRKAAAGRRVPGKTPSTKSLVKERGPTAMVTVMEVIRRSKKGITTAEIKGKTGFSERKIWDNVNRLKRQRKVNSGGRGLYMSA